MLGVLRLELAQRFILLFRCRRCARRLRRDLRNFALVLLDDRCVGRNGGLQLLANSADFAPRCLQFRCKLRLFLLRCRHRRPQLVRFLRKRRFLSRQCGLGGGKLLCGLARVGLGLREAAPQGLHLLLQLGEVLLELRVRLLQLACLIGVLGVLRLELACLLVTALLGVS